MQPTHVKQHFEGKYSTIENAGGFTVYPFAHVPHTWHWTVCAAILGPSAGYAVKDQKMPGTKAWDANRNENKRLIQYI